MRTERRHAPNCTIASLASQERWSSIGSTAFMRDAASENDTGLPGKRFSKMPGSIFPIRREYLRFRVRSPSRSVVALSSPSTTRRPPSSRNAIPFGPSTRKSSTRHQMIAAPWSAIIRPMLPPRTIAPSIEGQGSPKSNTDILIGRPARCSNAIRKCRTSSKKSGTLASKPCSPAKEAPCSCLMSSSQDSRDGLCRACQKYGSQLAADDSSKTLFPNVSHAADKNSWVAAKLPRLTKVAICGFEVLCSTSVRRSSGWRDMSRMTRLVARSTCSHSF